MTRADCGPVVIMCLGTMYGHVGMRWHVDALRLMWPRLRALAVEVAELPDAVLDLESCDTVAALGSLARGCSSLTYAAPIALGKYGTRICTDIARVSVPGYRTRTRSTQPICAALWRSILPPRARYR